MTGSFAPNDPPVAEDNAAETEEDRKVTIAVLANDHDPDGDALHVTDTSQPAHGTVSVNPDSTVTYRPDRDFHGSDVFTYTVSDGKGPSIPATVSITVTAVNDAPKFTRGPTATPDRVPVTQLVAFSADAFDADGEPLTYRWDFGDQTSDTGNSVTHAYGAPGEYSVRVTTIDGSGGRAEATLEVTVTTAVRLLLDPANPRVLSWHPDRPEQLKPVRAQLTGGPANVLVELRVFGNGTRQLGSPIRTLKLPVFVPQNSPAAVTLRWNGTDDSGAPLSPGIYTYDVVVRGGPAKNGNRLFIDPALDNNDHPILQAEYLGLSDGGTPKDPGDDCDRYSICYRVESEGFGQDGPFITICLYDSEFRIVESWPVENVPTQRDPVPASREQLVAEQHQIDLEVPRFLIEPALEESLCFVICALYRDGDDVAWAEACLPAVPRVSDVTVESVEWVGYDPGDGNTNHHAMADPLTAGGDIIYAERNQPVRADLTTARTGAQLHHRIRARARLSAVPPLGSVVTIWFRVFDPDHHSSDPSFDINGNDPNDNTPAGGGESQLGALLYWPNFGWQSAHATILADGVNRDVYIGMEITLRQPGNNFRIVAHPRVSYLGDIRFGAGGQLREGVAGPPVPAASQTRTLTVWRTLHVERDSMGAPQYEQAPAPSKFPRGTATLLDRSKIRTNVTIHATGCRNQFENGSITLVDDANGSYGPFATKANTTGAQAIIELADPLPETVPAAGRTINRFRNLEDDDIRHAIQAEDMRPNLSLWAPQFAFAAIRVNASKTDLSPLNANDVNQTNIPFLLNTGTDGTDTEEDRNVIMIIRAHKQSVCTTDFWVVYQLGAFQAGTHNDRDPFIVGRRPDGSFMFDLSLLGSCLEQPTPHAEAGTVVYAETIRDLIDWNIIATPPSEANFLAAVCLHEIGHMFSLTHDAVYGSLMDYGFQDTPDAQFHTVGFSGASLRKITVQALPSVLVGFID